MKILLDTHFIVWILDGTKILRRYPWLERFGPWGVSPASLLEMQFLSEVGRLEVKNPGFTDALLRDPRFVVDDVAFLTVVRAGLEATWTRDPFDRLLVAHSTARRTPLCTTDRSILENHRWVVDELAPGSKR